LTCSGVHQHASKLELRAAVSVELVHAFKGATACVQGYCLTPDGKTVVSADADCMLRLWNVETGTLSRTLEHTEQVTCVDVSPDGEHILAGCVRHHRLWNFTTEVLECTLPIEWSSCCCCCSFSPNGALFLVGDGASLKLYDSMTHQLQHTFNRPYATLSFWHSKVWSCTHAPDGASILGGFDDGTLKLWCVVTGRLLRTLYGHFRPVLSCAFSPTGLTIVSASRDRTLRLWTAATGRLQRIINTDSGVISSCFSPDGKSILSGHEDGSTKLWAHLRRPS
jgi:WD40 repeat protein